jgi:hypothetical protein
MNEISRRAFLGDMGTGLQAIALASLLRGPGEKHHAPRAKQVLQIFCPGAVSSMDTFDFKPELEKQHGKPLPGGEKIVTFQGAQGNVMKSPWGWKQYGDSGKWISDLLPNLGRVADDLCFIHSLTSKSNTHGPATLQMNTGFILEGFPSIGAWTVYALGSESRNLPAYVAIPDPRGLPPSGPANWTNGFLPAAFQGTAFGAARPIANLADPPGTTPDGEKDVRDFVGLLNSDHAERNPGHSDLQARIAAYELAARMQLSAPEVADFSREDRETLALYGADSANPVHAGYGRNCILARRLLERGVRFVQLFCGAHTAAEGQFNWDSHRNLKADYERHTAVLDRPTAALLRDLKRRGMLDDVLVLWTTEFGRMPTHQANTDGRDHNPNGFTVWMAGAGVKAGYSHGATDDFGYKAVEKVATIHDFHATVLHLLGLDHEKLTFYHNGIQRRLTDVHGHVIRDLLA